MSHLTAVFRSADGLVCQTLNFASWDVLGFRIAAQVVAGFEEAAKDSTPTSRTVQRTYLNKLKSFLISLGSDMPASLDAMSRDHLSAFAETLKPVASTRSSNWRVATQIIVHAYRSAGRKPPPISRSPWTTTRAAKPIEQQLAPAAMPAAAAAARAPQGKKSRALLVNSPVARVQSGTEDAGVVPLDIPPAIRRPDADKLEIFFPARGDQPAQIIDLSHWLQLGDAVAMDVAGIFAKVSRASAVKTRDTRKRQIAKFFQFLEKRDKTLVPQRLHLTEPALLVQYKRRLDALPSIETRSKHWRLTIRFIETACVDAGAPIPKHDPAPWPGAHARSEGKSEILTAEVVGRILRACMSDMAEILTAAEDDDYEGPALADMLPFIIPFTFWTIFNAETATAQRRSDVRPDMLGRIAIVGRKPRASVDQVASFPSADTHICSPPTIIANVERLTAKLRERLPLQQQDYLFVGRMMELQRSDVEIKPFALVAGGMQTFYRKRFCEKHGLEPFNLRMIRATGGTIVNKLFGDDEKTAQAMMQHLSIDTTDAYVRREALRSEQLRLADQMEKRQRFVRTDGRRDVRDQPLATQTAATPGFVCADAYDPPAYLGQEPGMCAAYGACPTCPLASVDRLCPTSLAFALRLRNQIRAAHANHAVDPHRWIKIWKPRLAALDDTWLPSFDPSAHAIAAERIRDVSLAPLPGIGEV